MQIWYWYPDPWLMRINHVIAGVVCVAVFLSGLPWLARWVLIAVYTFYALWLAICTRRNTRQGLRYYADGWQLWDEETEGWQTIQLSPHSLVLPQVIILYFRRANHWRRWALVLPAYVLDSEEHRALRVRLRFG